MYLCPIMRGEQIILLDPVPWDGCDNTNVVFRLTQYSENDPFIVSASSRVQDPS